MLRDVPVGAHISHVFVMGQDRSFTKDENARLVAEVETYQDILIGDEEEQIHSSSGQTKDCIYWVTKNHQFDILIKTEDDSVLFLSRLFGTQGWLKGVDSGELLYFGKKHALVKVPNPANFGRTETVNTDTLFEFDYRGVYWPEFMEGGMYGLSRALAEEVVKNDFNTYESEDAMVGVWVSGFPTKTRYLTDEQVLSRQADYFSSNGTLVAAAFQVDPLHLASMWCEYDSVRTLSPRSIMAKDSRAALDCLGRYGKSSGPTRSQPLGARGKHRAAMLTSLKREWQWPTNDRPDVTETGQWWARMRGVFHGKAAAVVGTSATIDRLPLYLLEGMHTLAMDDYFRVSERYTSWVPTMYMCVDPKLCASGGGSGSVRGGGKGFRGPFVNVEGANRFARQVFAAFYIISGGVKSAQYWRYLRQRANTHWFVAGMGEGASRGGALGGVGAIHAPLGMEGAMDGVADNFGVSAQTSGVAMGVEVLSYLGFSPVYVTAASEEIEMQWDEVSEAVQMAASRHGTEVVYLYADMEDRLPEGKVCAVARGRGGGGNGGMSSLVDGKLSAQENFLAWAKRRSHSDRLEAWDLEMFLQHYPVTSRAEIVRGASKIDRMFPKSPRCRDAADFDRFEKAVLCSVNISLKHFSSFLTWHIPYGPVQGTFVWTKR